MSQIKIHLNTKTETLTIFMPPPQDGEIRELKREGCTVDALGRSVCMLEHEGKVVGFQIEPFVLAVDTSELTVETETTC